MEADLRSLLRFYDVGGYFGGKRRKLGEAISRLWSFQSFLQVLLTNSIAGYLVDRLVDA